MHHVRTLLSGIALAPLLVQPLDIRSDWGNFADLTMKPVDLKVFESKYP